MLHDFFNMRSNGENSGVPIILIPTVIYHLELTQPKFKDERLLSILALVLYSIEFHVMFFNQSQGPISLDHSLPRNACLSKLCNICSTRLENMLVLNIKDLAGFTILEILEVKKCAD